MTRTDRVALAVIVVAFGVGYALYGLFRHWHFGSSAYDMGIFDQVVWHLSRFEAPASSVRGFSNFLGDHFFPVIVLFAPLYWVAPRPEMLIAAQAALFAAQAALFAASIVPVFLFTRDRLPRGPTLLLAIAYGCFWGLQRAMAFDVHETAFAPLAIAIAILAMDRRRWLTFWLAAVFMVLIKEDLIPMLGGFGIYLVLQRERRRGTVLMVASGVAFALVFGVIVPAFSDTATYGYGAPYRDLLRQPWLIPSTLVTPPTKMATTILWFLPFACVSLASPLAMLVVPLALTRFLSDSPNHWGTVFHYSAPLAPILAMAAADGTARIARRLRERHTETFVRRVVLGVAAASLVLSAFIPGRQPLWRVFAPGHYRSTDVDVMGRVVVAMIPDRASVVAQAAIVPHLSTRPEIYVLDASAPEADYVVMSEQLHPWPVASIGELKTLIDDRRARGYDVVFQQQGWTVLRR